MNYLGNAAIYLTDTLIGLALYIVLLRFWLQWVRGNFRNPIGQILINTSNPLVLPLRRIIPSFGSIDTATVVLAIIIAAIKTLVLSKLAGQSIAWLSLISYSFGELIRCSIYIFMAAIFIQIIASWLNPHSAHPVLDIAHSIAEPLMAPVRRVIPPFGGLDLSPIFVFLFLQLSLQLIVAPLQSI